MLIKWSQTLGVFTAMIFTLIIIAFVAHRYMFGTKDFKQKTGLSILREWSIFLLAGGLISQIWVHVDINSFKSLLNTELFTFPGVHHTITAKFLINDGPIMTGFFGLAAAELAEALFLPNGSLKGWKAAVPVGGTIGGVLFPIGIFLLICSPDMNSAFPVPCATDIAFAWLGARIVFGEKSIATIFLLAIAIVDDFIGMAMIAVLLPQGDAHFYGYIVLAIGVYSAYRFRQKSKVNQFFADWKLYYLVSGTLVWYGLHWAGLHSALALVFVVPFMPLASSDGGMFDAAEHDEHSPINKFKHYWEIPVDVGLFMFGLLNAGVIWIGVSNAWTQNSTAVFIALGLGKIIGIPVFSYLTFKLIKKFKTDFEMPQNEFGTLTWRNVIVVSIFAAAGFTVALFVIDAGKWPNALKLGALASLLYILLGIACAKLFAKVNKAEELEKQPSTNVAN